MNTEQERADLLPCPFCGAGKTEVRENGRPWLGTKWGEPVSVSVRHWCDHVDGQPSRMIERVGRDRAAAIAAWNRRAALQSHDAEDAERHRRLRKGDIADVAFARDLAMRMTAKADIPYCAEFAAIAQELDAVIAQAAEHSKDEPVGYIMPTAIKQLRAGGNAIVGGLSQGGDVAVYLAPQPLSESDIPAEPVKSHLNVSYDDKFDCLYVVCDSNEPADAEEDDKGILYRRAISDGRLIGITISNFMGQYAKWSDDVQRPDEPVKVPSDADIDELSREWGLLSAAYPSKSMVRDFARALLARYGGGTP